MKLLTAIKKAQKKSSERYGEVTYWVRKKYERFTCYKHISVCGDDIQIEGTFELEDLTDKDWEIVEDD